MNKRYTTAGAMTGAIVAAGLMLPSAAMAAECGTPAKDAVYKTVTIPGTPAVYEDVTVLISAAVPEVPAVYRDVKIIDVPAQEATPGTPAVEEVSHFDQVLVTPAIPAVVEVSHVERYLVSAAVEEVSHSGPGDRHSYNPKAQDNQDPTVIGSTPLNDLEHWQLNQKGYDDSPLNEYLQQGGGNNGDNASWFWWTSVKVIDVPAKDAVYGERTVVDVEGRDAVPAVYQDVKVIDVPAKDAVPGTPAVEEVSHIERVLVTPAVPGTPAVTETITILVKAATEPRTATVLISAAVPAGPACTVETGGAATAGGSEATGPALSGTSDVPLTAAGRAELAATGSSPLNTGLVGTAFLLVGGVATGLRRRIPD